MTVRSGEHGPAVPRQDHGAVGDPPERQANGQPGDRISEAVQAAQQLAQEGGGFGTPGRPLDRRSPFFVGMAAAAGVAVTIALSS